MAQSLFVTLTKQSTPSAVPCRHSLVDLAKIKLNYLEIIDTGVKFWLCLDDAMAKGEQGWYIYAEVPSVA